MPHLLIDGLKLVFQYVKNCYSVRVQYHYIQRLSIVNNFVDGGKLMLDAVVSYSSFSFQFLAIARKAGGRTALPALW